MCLSMSALSLECIHPGRHVVFDSGTVCVGGRHFSGECDLGQEIPFVGCT